ncbi:MAG: 50S ribosomal protein L21 [Caulobacter sp.]|nr:50S ribosomal protein L21 [Caulobacter sp.]
MYAVIKTGGKQYRVQAGDVLVVEKLAGEPGADVAFGEVLMLGDGEAITVGAPLVDGATVTATLIETRKGEKVKIFKKIRRQGYRRTRGHRQTETVLRVISVAGAGKTDKWDGTVDLTTKAELNARSRNLKFIAPVAADAAPAAKAAPVKKAAAPKAKAEAAPAAEAAPKKAAAPKAAKADDAAAPAKKAAPKKAAAKKEADEA